MINDYSVGAFRGRKLIQRSGNIGGSKSVFVKLQGIKNELVYPTFGGFIKNPYKNGGKFFAGDLCEYRTNEDGLKPEIYILKTFLVESVAGSVVNVVRDGYKHKPCVGDVIGVAPAQIGGELAVAATVTAVANAKVGSVDVWAVTVATPITATKGDVLVEGDAEGKMLVKNINAVCDSDLDLLDVPVEDDADFEGARYAYTPALGGIMYTKKMSPIPACVAKLNQSKVNGWFQIQSV